MGVWGTLGCGQFFPWLQNAQPANSPKIKHYQNLGSFGTKEHRLLGINIGPPQKPKQPSQ